MIAKAYVENGAKVYIVSRKQEVCERVAAALNELGPGSAISMPADLSTDASCRQLAAQLADRETRLDVLVNNAGVTWGASFEDFPEKAWGQWRALIGCYMRHRRPVARSNFDVIMRHRRPDHGSQCCERLQPHTGESNAVIFYPS